MFNHVKKIIFNHVRYCFPISSNCMEDADQYTEISVETDHYSL